MLPNGILFIPFGIFMNMKFSIKKTIIISIIFPLSIEVDQFNRSGSCGTYEL